MGYGNGIQIDTERVGDLAGGMRADAGKDFSHAANRGADLHSHGIVFGDSLQMSDVIDYARERYRAALINTEANVRAYQQAADTLATIADQIAQQFSTADHASAEGQARMQALMATAVAEVNRFHAMASQPVEVTP